MKKFFSLLLTVVLVFALILPSATVFAATKINYSEEYFNFIPSETVSVNNKTYRKLVVKKPYEGLRELDIIYIDDNNYLVTDRSLIEKLAYVSMVRGNIVVGTDTYKITQLADDIVYSANIIETLGNNLIEDTLGNAVTANLAGITNAFLGNLSGWKISYLDFVESFGIDSMAYLCYLSNLYDLMNSCIENMMVLHNFNTSSTVKNIDQYGLSFSDAQKYENIVRTCMSCLLATEYYITHLAENISGGEINSCVDASDVLGNIVKQDINSAFWTSAGLEIGKPLAEALKKADSYKALFKEMDGIFKLTDNLSTYYSSYAIFDVKSPLYVDVDEIMENVRILTGIDYTPPTSTTYSIGTYKPSSTSGLNMRSGNSVSYSKVGGIAYGNSFVVTAVKGNWGNTTCGGVTGWVCLDYATYVSSSTSTPTASGNSSIKGHMKSIYEKALANANMSSFNGWCGECVAQQLLALGINKSKIVENGNDTYNKYSGMSTTSGGYTVNKYPTSSYSMRNALNLLNNSPSTYTYALMNFEKSPGTDGQKYGHTLLVYAVIDGIVYYAESFTISSMNSVYGVRSIDSFCSAYGQSGYVYEGMIWFTGGDEPSNEEIETPVESVVIAEGTYVINSLVNSYRYLTAKTDANYGQVQGKPFENINAQKFEIVKSNGDYKIVSKNSASGRVVNVARDGICQNGDNVILWDYTGDGTQIWKFQKVDGAYVIHPKNNTALALTALSNGGIAVNTYTGAPNQLWNFENIDNDDTNEDIGWTEWSEWSTEPIEASEYIRVQTATEYGYYHYVHTWTDTMFVGAYPVKSSSLFTSDSSDVIEYHEYWSSTKLARVDGVIYGNVRYDAYSNIHCELKGNKISSINYLYSTGKTRTLYRRSIAQFEVHYDANGGVGAPESQSKEYGTDIAISTLIPTRDGYDFLGWATSTHGDVEYEAGGTFNQDSNAVLYAVWEKEVACGDATGDGEADITDMMYLARYVANWKGYSADTVNVNALDLNLDGRVNPLDLVVLARHLAKWKGYETLPYDPS